MDNVTIIRIVAGVLFVVVLRIVAGVLFVVVLLFLINRRRTRVR